MDVSPSPRATFGYLLFQKPGDRGTITDMYHQFNPDNDAEALRKAMSGPGTDEAGVINILCKRNWRQRKMIAETFFEKYELDLMETISSDISYTLYFHRTLKALMTYPYSYDAEMATLACRHAGTDEKLLLEVIAARSYEERQEIIKEYETNKYCQSGSGPKRLLDLVCDDTSGDLRELLRAYILAERHGDPLRLETDALVEKDAKVMQQDGLKGTLKQILPIRTYAHLRKVFRTYELIKEMRMEEMIYKEPTIWDSNEDYISAYLDIVEMIKDKDLYFAKRLYWTMKGPGTNEEQLIHLIVSRSETDMVQIKEKYKEHFGHTLESRLEDDISGWFLTSLLTIIR